MEKVHEYLAISEPDAKRIKCSDRRLTMILPERLQPMEEVGHRVKIVSIRRLPLLQRRIRELHRKGLFEPIFFEENMTEFRFDPPSGLPDAHSLIIVPLTSPSAGFHSTLIKSPFPCLSLPLTRIPRMMKSSGFSNFAWDLRVIVF